MAVFGRYIQNTVSERVLQVEPGPNLTIQVFRLLVNWQWARFVRFAPLQHFHAKPLPIVGSKHALVNSKEKKKKSLPACQVSTPWAKRAKCRFLYVRQILSVLHMLCFHCTAKSSFYTSGTYFFLIFVRPMFGQNYYDLMLKNKICMTASCPKEKRARYSGFWENFVYLITSQGLSLGAYSMQLLTAHHCSFTILSVFNICLKEKWPYLLPLVDN